MGEIVTSSHLEVTGGKISDITAAIAKISASQVSSHEMTPIPKKFPSLPPSNLRSKFHRPVRNNSCLFALLLKYGKYDR